MSPHYNFITISAIGAPGDGLPPGKFGLPDALRICQFRGTND